MITFLKTLETVMFNRLNLYLQANNIFVPQQLGFRNVLPFRKSVI